MWWNLNHFSQVSIALMQKGRRQLRDELGSWNSFLPIGLTLFKLNEKIGKPLEDSVPGILVGGMAYSYYRTTTLQTKLPKGQGPLPSRGRHLLPRHGGPVLPQGRLSTGDRSDSPQIVKPIHLRVCTAQNLIIL